MISETNNQKSKNIQDMIEFIMSSCTESMFQVLKRHHVRHKLHFGDLNDKEINNYDEFIQYNKKCANIMTNNELMLAQDLIKKIKSNKIVTRLVSDGLDCSTHSIVSVYFDINGDLVLMHNEC